jgi:hypothetical protein
LPFAGRCGLGAAAVARSRGVWVAGEDEYGMTEQSWVLTSMFKDFPRGPHDALQAFLTGRLPAGGDLVLGMDDGYAIGMTMHPALPPPAQSKVMELCSRRRQRAKSTA